MQGWRLTLSFPIFFSIGSLCAAQRYSKDDLDLMGKRRESCTLHRKVIVSLCVDNERLERENKATKGRLVELDEEFSTLNEYACILAAQIEKTKEENTLLRARNRELRDRIAYQSVQCVAVVSEKPSLGNGWDCCDAGIDLTGQSPSDTVVRTGESCSAVKAR